MDNLEEGGVGELLEDDRGQLSLVGVAALYAKIRDEDLDELKEDAARYACDKYFAAREYFS